jgi:DNA-binding winged helix-turn-helix (wHTH) protein/tetratricopeptide (TPR) repeat protein
MPSAPQDRRLLRFGEFQLDVQSAELRKPGMTVRLPDQPFRLLLLLLERAGEVVTREEIRDTLWAADTFVDFDTGLNSIVRKLRETLGDSAEHPGFIETLPRRGYRFIAAVTPVTTDPLPQPEARRAATGGWRVRLAWIAGALVVATAVGTLALALWSGRSDRVPADAVPGGAGSPAADRDPLGRRAIDPTAYDAYMKGVAAAGVLTYEGHRNAVGYFEDAIAKQPDFAMAYASLGSSQLQFLWVGPLSPRETVPKAEAATRKALQLDDTLPLAHRTLAGILRYYHWQWEEADKALQRAEGRGSLAESSTMELIQSGQFALAIARAERARRLDPLSFEAAVNLASAFRAAGQYDRAVAEYKSALEITPRRPRGHFQLGVTFVFMGRLREAVDELETAVRLSSGNSRFDAYLAYAYVAAGRPRDARRILKALEARARNQYVSRFGLALIYDALGEKEQAFAAFERAYQDRAVEFSQMKQYPPFKTIASDPRFQARMREIGLPR